MSFIEREENALCVGAGGDSGAAGGRDEEYAKWLDSVRLSETSRKRQQRYVEIKEHVNESEKTYFVLLMNILKSLAQRGIEHAKYGTGKMPANEAIKILEKRSRHPPELKNEFVFQGQVLGRRLNVGGPQEEYNRATLTCLVWLRMYEQPECVGNAYMGQCIEYIPENLRGKFTDEDFADKVCQIMSDFLNEFIVELAQETHDSKVLTVSEVTEVTELPEVEFPEVTEVTEIPEVEFPEVTEVPEVPAVPAIPEVPAVPEVPPAAFDKAVPPSHLRLMPKKM